MSEQKVQSGQNDQYENYNEYSNKEATHMACGEKLNLLTQSLYAFK